MSHPTSEHELDEQATARSGQRGVQRTFLGLTHNPFTPPREGFFPGGDRKTHLEHLRHLSQWSRRILVVSGPFGVGKSSLFRELSGSLEPNTKAARLAGTVITSEREALVGLLQGFGIGADNNAHANDLADLVVRHVDEQEAHRRVCMVMVDDAHLLDLQAIQRLVSLVARSGLRLLLFTEANLVSALDQAAKKHELEWFEIRLTGFPRADVRDYLEWRFRQAAYRGLLPFSDEQLEKIVHRSGGNPSVIDSMANRLLAEMESGEIRRARPQFPVLHASLAVLLAVLVALVYLFVQDELEPTQVASGISTTDAAAGQPEAVNVPVEAPIKPAPGTALDEAPDETSLDAGLANELATGVGNVDEAGVEPVGATTPSAVEPDVDASVEPATGVTQQVDTPAEPQAQAQSIEVSAPPTSNGTQQAESSAPPTPTMVDQAETSPPVPEEQSAQTMPVIESQPVAAEPQAPTSVRGTPSQDGATPAEVQQALARYKNGSWLLAQDSSRFTLQMLTLSSAERVLRFIQRQSNPEEFAVYRMRRDGKNLFVVTYGIFSGKAAADQAATNLSGELASIKPWVRPLELVQQTIRDNPQT